MLDRQLRCVIADYVADRIDLAALEETVVSETWTAARDGEWVAAAIADRVMFEVAEIDAGLTSEEEARARLAPLAPEWTVSTFVPATGSSSPSQVKRWLAGAAVVGTPREVVSG